MLLKNKTDLIITNKSRRAYVSEMMMLIKFIGFALQCNLDRMIPAAIALIKLNGKFSLQSSRICSQFFHNAGAKHKLNK